MVAIQAVACRLPGCKGPSPVAYLACWRRARGVVPAEGWDKLVKAVTAREAQIEAGIDGPTVRRVLERLATRARVRAGGLGPFSPDELVTTFREVCGYSPDEPGMVLLQRLPGLGVDDAAEGSRAFIDGDFADACRSGDVLAFCRYPHDQELSCLGVIEHSMGELGIDVLSTRANEQGLVRGQVEAALNVAIRNHESDVVASDLVRMAMACGFDLDHSVEVRDVFVDEIYVGAGTGSCTGVTFRDSYISRLVIDIGGLTDGIPAFRGCYIGELEGDFDRGVPPARVALEDTIVDSINVISQTTRSILELDLPRGVRVLLTVLKKLYRQRGKGRKQSALLRGLDHQSQRLVEDVLVVVKSEGLANPAKRGETIIWLPDRSQSGRVGRLLSNPHQSADSIVRKCAQLS